MNAIQPNLLARISYQINVYDAGNNEKAIEIKEECFNVYNFIKGNKKEAKRFLDDIAKICGVEIEIKE